MRAITRAATCMLLASVLGPIPAWAQTIANVERQLLPLQESSLKGAPGVEPMFWDSLAWLRAEEDRQRALKGAVTFGLTGDEAGPRSLFKLNTGISLTRGVFPSEISVDTSLSLQLVDGQVQEDMTNLKVSYDYHATRHLEYFAFAERFSDNFLSIQQRYEVGFGGRVGVGLGRLDDWRETDQQLETLRRSLPGVRAVASTLPSATQTRLRATGFLDEARFDQTLQNLDHLIRDRQTRLFLAMAASVFAEIEHASIDVVSSPANADSSDADVKTKISIEGAQRYRLNLRPSLRYRASREVLIRVFPYIKLPLGGPQRVTLPNGERRFDYRRDVLSEMTWSIRPEDTGVEAVDFVFTFNHYFDNVPPVVPEDVVTAAAAAGLVLDRVSAEQGHRFVSMSMRIRW